MKLGSDSFFEIPDKHQTYLQLANALRQTILARAHRYFMMCAHRSIQTENYHHRLRDQAKDYYLRVRYRYLKRQRKRTKTRCGLVVTVAKGS